MMQVERMMDDYRPEPAPPGADDATLQGTWLWVSSVVGQAKAARRAMGLEIKQVARLSGLSVTTLSELENGRATNPRVDTLFAYLQAIGKTLPDRLEDMDPEYRDPIEPVDL